MTDAPRCPPIEILEQAIAAEPLPAELAAHLAECRRCRRRVDRLRDNATMVAATRGLDSQRLVAALDVSTNRATPVLAPPPGYELLGELHRGGQGVVYRALQKATKRPVAIKVVLRGALATTRQRTRFEREIEIAAQLRHPNIVTIHESGAAADGSLYFVMEYVDGAPLDEFLASRRERMTIDAVARLFCKVCDAVNYAHQRGIIHRDLKPGNILIDAAGEPRVLDFGLAKAVGDAPESRAAATRTGDFLGTFSYAAPEQLRGDPEQVDIRSDVYALGVILYQMLTGRFPYPLDGSLSAVIRHITETEPTPPSRHVGAIPDDLDTIVAKALAKEPVRRYQSAGSLGRDVLRFLAGEPIDAKRDSHWYVLRKTARRYRGALTVAALFVLLLAGFGVTMTIVAQRSRERARQLAESLYDSQIERARALTAAGGAAAAEELLWRAFLDPPASGAVGDPSRDPARRRALWALAELYDAAPCRRTVALDSAPEDALQVSRDGRYLCWLSALGHWGRINIETGEREERADKASTTGSFALDESGSRMFQINDDGVLTAWHFGRSESGVETRRLAPWSATVFLRAVASREGKWLAAAQAGGRVRIWDSATEGAAIELPGDGSSGEVSSLEFSRDASRLAVGTMQGRVMMWSLPGAGPSARPRVLWARDLHRIMVRVVAFSPDETLLATGGADGDNRILIVSAADGTPRHTLVGHVSHINALAFSPDGSELCSGSFDNTLRRWDVASGAFRAGYAGHAGGVLTVRYSPDGRSILTAARDGTLRLWDLAPTAPHVRRVDSSRPAMSLCLSRDGRTLYVATNDGGVRGLDTATGRPKINFAGHPVRAATIRLSPNGRLLASASVEPSVRLWDAESGELRGELRGFGGPVSSLAFHPDGGMVATGSDDGIVRLWNIDRQTCTHTLQGSERFQRRPSLAFSPDGTTLAACDGFGEVWFWDWAAARVRFKIRAHVGQARSVLYAPGGRLIATAGDDASVRLWDASDGAAVATLQGHTADVFVMSFSPDGALLASAGRDRTIRVWDVAARRCLRTLTGHQGMIFAIQFSPDGTFLATCGAAGEVCVWDLAEGASRVAGNLEYQLSRKVDLQLDAARLAELRGWAKRVLAEPRPRFDWSAAGP